MDTIHSEANLYVFNFPVGSRVARIGQGAADPPPPLPSPSHAIAISICVKCYTSCVQPFQ